VTVSAHSSEQRNALQTASGNSKTELDIPISNPNFGHPTNPFLYNLQVSVMQSGTTNDSVTSYLAHAENIHQHNRGHPRIYLITSQSLGWGRWIKVTAGWNLHRAHGRRAKFDIQEIKALGFNTIRKHEKVERQRWYYWPILWASWSGRTCRPAIPTPATITAGVDPLQFIAELSAW